MSERGPWLADLEAEQLEAAVMEEALRRYGHPVTGIEAMEFHLLKGEIRQEWAATSHPQRAIRANALEAAKAHERNG